MIELGFSSIHPFPSFLYYVGVILFSMTFYHPIYLFTGLIILILVNYIQDRGKKLKEYSRFYIIMGLLIVLLNPLISRRGETILFYFLDRPITLESIIYGITMMFSLMNILVSFISFNYIITQDKFMYLFSRYFPNITFLLMMTMGFIPFLKKRAEEISTVQKTKGIDASKGTFKEKVKNGMTIFNILVTWALEDSIITAQSMRARGYGLVKDRTFYSNYKIDCRDIFILLVTIVLIFLLMFLWLNNFISYNIYPKVDKLTMDANMIIFYLLYIFYMSIPILIEGIDRLKWQK